MGTRRIVAHQFIIPGQVLWSRAEDAVLLTRLGTLAVFFGRFCQPEVGPLDPLPHTRKKDKKEKGQEGAMSIKSDQLAIDARGNLFVIEIAHQSGRFPQLVDS